MAVTRKAKTPASPSPANDASGDEALWREVAKTVKPLRARKPAPKAALVKSNSVASPVPPAVGARKRIAPSPATKPRGPAPPPELAAGEVAAVDRRLGERLRRGQLAIDARLDLHGHFYDSGAREVADFIASAYERGLRMVLIVTGKGSRSGGEGILRQSLPRWLNAPGLRHRVLAFSAAQPRHGGDGAFYVLLKRKRRRAVPGSADPSSADNDPER